MVEFDASSLVSSPVPTDLPVYSVAPHVSSTAITRNALTPVGTNAAFTSSNWPISTLAPTSAKYLTFTLTADPGYVLDLSGATIYFDCRKSGTGPFAVHLYTSVGGFVSSSNSLATVTPIVSSGGTPFVYSFSAGGSYDNLSNIEIRIYGDQAGSTGGQLRILDPAAGGNIRIGGGVVKPYLMSSLPCGISYTRKSTVVNASYAQGATGYRFRFYNNSTGALISQYTQASRTLTLSSVPNLYYNTTYKWTVAVDIGYGYGPESSGSCSVTLAPAQTTLPNGAYYSRLNGYAAVPNPIGVTNYRFTIYNSSTGAIVAQRTQASNYLYFSTLSGLYYGTTYYWTVACQYPLAAGGYSWGPESNPTNTLSFGPAQTTLPCGVTYNSLNTYTAVSNPGSVLNYRFTFYDNSTGTLVAQTTQASNYLYFNTVPGLAYGSTYRWTVACEYNLSGGGTAYGPESNNSCTVTFNAPVTTVPCGLTYSLSTGYSAATPVTGALGYRFRFYQNSVLAAEATSTSPYLYFNQVTGLVNNQSYNWTVEVNYNSSTGPAYGPASSSACTVTFGSPVRLAGEDYTEEDGSISVNTAVNIFPNPATDKITIACDEQVISADVYSVTGELVMTAKFTKELSVTDLSPGMYLLNVQTETGFKRTTFLKE